VWIPPFWSVLPGTSNGIATGPGQFFTARGVGDNRIYFWNGTGWFQSYPPVPGVTNLFTGDGQWATAALQVMFIHTQ
jgi:hypothetical protein